MEPVVQLRDLQSKCVILNDVSAEFRLYQNFPQTFYKITKIAFDIPNKTVVKLVIYDVFGREVDTLVNENLAAGSYEIKWNAYRFSAGVYYYKIFAGEFVDSKKMILIKSVNRYTVI